MIDIALCLGAPVTDPHGNMASKTSSDADPATHVGANFGHHLPDVGIVLEFAERGDLHAARDGRPFPGRCG